MISAVGHCHHGSVTTSSETGVPTTDAVTRALSRLVADGALTEVQAAAVAEAVEQEQADEPTRASAATPPVSSGGRLPEVLGYLGGTFVVAACVLVLGWTWEDFSFAARLGITVAGTAVTYGAGLLLATRAGGGRSALRQPAHDVRRRLVGLLLSAGALLAAGVVALIGDEQSVELLVPVSVTALVLSAVAVWLAPGLVPTLVAFGSSLCVVGGLVDWFDDVARLVWVLVYLLAGLAWVVVGPKLTGTRIASLALGLGTLVTVAWWAAAHTVPERTDPVRPDLQLTQPEWGEELVSTVGFVVLVALAVIGVLLYLRQRPWPWLVAGAAAAAVLVFQVAGDAFGPALASFVVGGLLVAASAVLLIRRSREGSPTASG